MTELDGEIERAERELDALKLKLFRLKAQRTAQRRADHCRRIYDDPTVLSRKSESMRAVWADPAKRAHMVEAQKKALAAKRAPVGDLPPIPTLAELVGA